MIIVLLFLQVRGREKMKLVSLTVDSLTPEEVQITRNDMDIDEILISTARETVSFKTFDFRFESLRFDATLPADISSVYQTRI